MVLCFFHRVIPDTCYVYVYKAPRGMEHTPPRRVQPCEEAAEKRLEWMLQRAQQQLAQNSAEKSAKHESARLCHTRKLSLLEWFLDFS